LAASAIGPVADGHQPPPIHNPVALGDHEDDVQVVPISFPRGLGWLGKIDLAHPVQVYRSQPANVRLSPP
jgi:hypothetical protein